MTFVVSSIAALQSASVAVPRVYVARVAGEEVAIVAIVFGVIAMVATPLVRALARRVECGHARPAAIPPETAERLERIERAVEAIAIEVERISEGQRFVTQLMSERPKPPSIGAGPQ
jgi:hypothetical protein